MIATLTNTCRRACNGLVFTALYIDEIADQTEKLTPGTPSHAARIAILEAYANAKRDEVLTDLYKTGRVDGLYFGRKSKAKNNPIKFYIKSCMYFKRIPVDAELVDDIYNEMFMHLAAMPATKLVSIYNESPSKLIATALKIISLKCFATDPRYNNPNHSFTTKLLHTSSFSEGVCTLDPSEVYLEQNEPNRVNNNTDEFNAPGLGATTTASKILTCKASDITDFEQSYGVSVDDIIDGLTDSELALFYEASGSQPRGKVSLSKQAKRMALYYKLVAKHSDTISENRTSTAKVNPVRKFKGSIYEKGGDGETL